MKPKKTKSLIGMLAATTLGGVLLYQSLKPGVSPLPEAIESKRDSFLTRDGVRVSYYVDKEASGRPVVLVHSINAAASSFEMKPFFTHYRNSRPIYALDWPGYGFSDRSSSQPYLPDFFAQTLIEMLETQVGEPADVIAHSLGSEFAARAALQRPDLFHSLTVISPTGMSDREINIPGETIYEIVNFPLWGQPLFELLTRRDSIRYFLGKNFVGEPDEAMIDYSYATSHQPEARYAPLYFLSGQMFSSDICEAVYQKLSVPSLVIYDRDPNVSFEKLPNLLAQNSLWQANRVAPSLGLPHWELLTETVAAIDAFWAEVEQQS